MNVLVGTSGAGKTTVMNGLNVIVQIANGRSQPHMRWEVEFYDNEGRTVIWQGQFSSKHELDDESKEIAELRKEQLTINSNVLISKFDGETTYNGYKLPVLDKNKSNVFLLREDEIIKSISKSLSSMIIVLNNSKVHTENSDVPAFAEMTVNALKAYYEEHKLKNIRELNENIPNINCRLKLFLAQALDKPSFDNLCFVYSSIFPTVKHIQSSLVQSETGQLDRQALFISLSLVDGTWIHQYDISSGMFKTLMLLSDLMFSSDNTVLLIDELENSLGVNCLPDIIQEIKSANFHCIVSTHHPKIINDIPVKHLKIVNRKGGEIHVDDATALENSSSHHDKFIQLINSTIYKNGNG